MIILDSHIWIWWVQGSSHLSVATWRMLDASKQTQLGVSVISCWEIAKLVQRGRLDLPCPVARWIAQALAYPGVRLLELSPRICVEATQLPGTFHKDPADQLIVATARVFDVPLVTVDAKILAHPHVRLLPVGG